MREHTASIIWGIAHALVDALASVHSDVSLVACYQYYLGDCSYTHVDALTSDALTSVHSDVSLVACYQ